MERNNENDEYFVRNLLCFVKQYPILYNRHHPGYENYAEKDKIWNRIGFGLNVSGDWCEKQFDSLYYKFCQYHCMLLDNELLAQGYPNDHFPYYREMEFCKNYIDIPMWSQKVRKMAGLIRLLNTSSNNAPSRDFPPHMHSQGGFNQGPMPDMPPRGNFQGPPMSDFQRPPMHGFPPDRGDRVEDFPNRQRMNEWGPSQSVPDMRSPRVNQWDPPQPVPPPNMRSRQDQDPDSWDSPHPPRNMRGVQSDHNMRNNQDQEPWRNPDPPLQNMRKQQQNMRPNQWESPPQPVPPPMSNNHEKRELDHWESPQPLKKMRTDQNDHRTPRENMRNVQEGRPAQWESPRTISPVPNIQNRLDAELDEENADGDSIDFFFRSVSEQVKKAELNVFKFLDLQMIILNGINQKLMIYRDFGSNPIPPASFDHQVINLEDNAPNSDLLPPPFLDDDENVKLPSRVRRMRPNLTQLT